jgi:hypothetical protein
LGESDSQIPNGTTMTCLGIQTSDIVPEFCGAISFSDIIKSATLRYYFKIKYKLIAATTANTMITTLGKNMLINRAFKTTPDYASPIYYTLGTATSLYSSMSGLTSVLIGPSSFTYNAVDTIAHKYVQRATLDKSTGNGSIFNAIGDQDSAANLFFAGKSFEDMYKTNTYVFMFSINNNLKTPNSSTE